LATVGLLASVALATPLAWLLLPLSWPQALLLAALLAPTDPVLASDVQVHGEHDRDGVRVSLSAEGALNDATAFPVVTLALGLLGLHQMGDEPFPGARWLALDLLWAVGAGVALGIACGRALGWVMARKLRAGSERDWDELLYIGAIALTYALSELVGASPFLAVFLAGATLLRPHPAERPEGEALEYGQQLQAFGARCERLVEVLMVLLVGVALVRTGLDTAGLLFGLLMLLVVRPLSVLASLPGAGLPRVQQRLVAWFGIRGVGSVFYLALALDAGVSGGTAQTLASAALGCIALSITLHGISATPLMNAYQARRARNRALRAD
ncbi:cation:proton antiporter, partial [Pelomonas sp. KK5]|uniref:cation:proton antiporter domain-containing protein n=1 Tax=Pelomonas sp. KK5 TaxID=1855730 RepID=UPI00097C1E53